MTEAVSGQIEQNFRITVLDQQQQKKIVFCLSPLPKKNPKKLLIILVLSANNYLHLVLWNCRLGWTKPIQPA